MKRALVFDFDGLILDTEWPEFQAWKTIFEQHGQPLPIEDWTHIVGTAPGMVDFRLKLEAQLGRNLDWSVLDVQRRTHHQVLIAEEEILPGVRELMIEASAKDWAVGVASSSNHEWVFGNLRRLGLDSWVETIRSKTNVKNLKPHPEPYLLACQDLGADPSQSFAFEDSATGVTAAKAAGMNVIAVPNRITQHHDLSAAHQVLKSLEDFILPA